MNHKMSPVTTVCVALSVLGIVLAEASKAHACSYVDPGVVVGDVPALRHPLPTDGVITLAVVFDRVDPVEIFSRYELRIEKDGQSLPGIVQFADLSAPPRADGTFDQLGILSFKPVSPLLANSSYRIVLREPSAWEPDTFEIVFDAVFTTGMGPQPSLPLPTPVLDAEIGLGLAEDKERACCEMLVSSCSVSFTCWPTAFTVRPVVNLKTSLDPETAAEAYPWVARLDDDGDPVEIRFGHRSNSWLDAWEYERIDVWRTAGDTFELRADTGVHCFAAGITSLRDFHTELGEPWCFDTDVVELPEPEYRELDLSTPRECVSEPIIEGLGTLGETGCAIGGRHQPPGWTALSMLFALGILRRRRAVRLRRRRCGRS